MCKTLQELIGSTLAARPDGCASTLAARPDGYAWPGGYLKSTMVDVENWDLRPLLKKTEKPHLQG